MHILRKFFYRRYLILSHAVYYDCHINQSIHPDLLNTKTCMMRTKRVIFQYICDHVLIFFHVLLNTISSIVSIHFLNSSLVVSIKKWINNSQRVYRGRYVLSFHAPIEISTNYLSYVVKENLCIISLLFPFALKNYPAFKVKIKTIYYKRE